MDVELILKKLESLDLIRLSKIRGDYYSIYCPIHKGGLERKPSCGVLLHDQYRNGRRYASGWVHCFTCGYSKSLADTITDILSLKHIDKSGIEWLKENIPDFDEDSIESDDLIPQGIMSNITNKYAIEYIHKKTRGDDKKFVSEEELEKYRFTVPYMYQRGLTDAIIDRYDIGFDKDHIPENKSKPVPCVTFPVRDRLGRCLFIFRRSIEGRYFNYPRGVEKPVYGLYELNPRAKTIVICESAFNMLTCVRHGYDSVALFGTGNALQMQQLKELGANRFILALDPDEAGERGTEKLRRNLKKVAFIYRVRGIPEGKDINDLTDEEFENLTIE